MASEPLAPKPLAPPPGLTAVKPGRQRTDSWPLIDRIGYWLCWATGVALCVIALAIVLFMFVKGISYLKPSLFFESPAPAVHQDEAGGFLDPIIGTFILTALGILIAGPIGIAIAAWLSEYARPRPLARAVESAIEMIGGVPSVVLAIFGLLVFSQGALGFLSQRAANGAARQSTAIRQGAITLEKVDMVEFLCLYETTASLSETPVTDKQRSLRHSHSSSPNVAMTLREPYSSNSFHLPPSLRPASWAALVRGTPWAIRPRTSPARLAK